MRRFSGEGGIRILAGADSGARSDADSRDSSRLATADEAVSHGGVRDERSSVVTRENGIREGLETALAAWTADRDAERLRADLRRLLRLVEETGDAIKQPRTE